MTRLQREILGTVLEVAGILCIAFAILLLLLGHAHGQTVQHTATLKWTAAVPASGQTLTGYNVYRAPTSGSFVLGVPFAKVPFGTNTYADSTIANGTFFYAVTTLCSNCSTGESGFSNQVEVLAAPTGLTVKPVTDLTIAPK